MTSEDVRLPLADALPGMTIHGFDSDQIPVSAFVLVKLLDDEGSPTWAFRTTETFNKEELLGALVVQVELLKASLVSDWETPD